MDWICKGQWSKAQVAEVSREAGVLPGKEITLLGFDIVFVFCLILSVGQKLLQILGLDESSSLFPMYRLLQNSNGVKIYRIALDIGVRIAFLGISGYQDQDTLGASIGMSGFLSGMKLWGIIFLSSEQSDNISHLIRRRTHI